MTGHVFVLGISIKPFSILFEYLIVVPTVWDFLFFILFCLKCEIYMFFVYSATKGGGYYPAPWTSYFPGSSIHTKIFKKYIRS